MTSPGAPPALSVLIATRNRAASLPRVLADLDAARRVTDGRVEIVVADNGSTDDTAAVIERWQGRDEDHRTLYVAEPGRSCALNRALAIARAPLISFTDDDVFIPPGWMSATLSFFATHPEYQAAMGRMLLPDEAAGDPEIRALVELYRTVPVFDRGEQVCDIDEFYGANVTIRRAVFDAIGIFDERLGVGASGNSEDFDFADRMRAANLRIGYNPGAVICHEIDRRRLTPRFHAEFQRRLGASEALRSRGGFAWRSAMRAIESSFAALWFAATGSPVRRTHAWGRVIRHTHALRTLWGRWKVRE